MKTDQLSIAYSTWDFSETLAGRVPHEGISRIIRSRKSKHSGAMERRGLAFILEHGFMKTEEGRRQYMLNIQQIVQAVQVTLNFDVLSALLTCKRYDIQWMREHGYFRQHLPEIMKREVSMFGIIQKDVNGFDIAIEEYKKQLGRYSVAPDSLILPSKLQMYIPMVPEEKTLYSNRGKLGVDQFEAGPIRSFRNIRIYEAKAFDLGNGELPINLMSSGKQIGQHNIMALDENTDPADYRSEQRDIMIYDADIDNFARVSFLDAAKHSLRFDDESKKLHYEFLNKNEGEEHLDFMLYKDEGEGTWKKVNYFGQLHKDGSKHIDFLPKSLLSKVIGSAHKLVSERVIADFEDGCLLIEEKKREGGNVGRQYKQILSLADKRAKKFASAWEKVYRALEQAFPDSKLFTLPVGTVEQPAPWVVELGLIGDNIKTARHIRMAALYLAVFGDREEDLTTDSASDSDGSGGVPLAAPFSVEHTSKTHEMNIGALKHSKALDSKLYKDAVAKYEAGTDMHTNLVHGVAQLIGQHVDNLQEPMFTNTYSMLSKFSGRASSDQKQMQRMGLEKLAKDAKEAMKVAPGKMMSAAAGTVLHPGSPSFIGSPLHKMLSYGEGAEDEEEEVSMPSRGASLFSRKSSRGGKAPRRVGAAADLAPALGADPEFSTKNFADRIEMVENMSDAMDVLIGMIFVTSRVSLKSIDGMHNNDIVLPFDIVLARPFIEFEMNHGLLTKSGRETGATYVGHSDFQLGDNVQSKLHYGNYTFYAKSLVTNPKNVVLLKDIFINNYLGGFNSRFWSAEDAQMDKHDDIFAMPNRPSLFSMLIPAGSMNRRAILGQDPVDLRSALPYYSWAFEMEGLEDPDYDEDFFEPNSQSSLNSMCYQGMQYSYNAAKKDFSKITLGTGHLGKNIYPGVREVYQGSMKFMEKKDYQQNF